MTLTQQLARLKPLGWFCEHPEMVHSPVGLDKKIRRCVWVEGPVIGYAERQAAYVSQQDDCVMVVGKVSMDVPFAEFIQWIQNGDHEEKNTPATNQKTLF